MSWEHRKPDGVGDIEYTDDGFTTGVSIPLDEDGFLGRECPTCEGPFKIHGDDYDALPADPVQTCPYCGHEQDHSSFLTRAQVERVDAAVNAIAEQYVHDALNQMLGKPSGDRSGARGAARSSASRRATSRVARRRSRRCRRSSKTRSGAS